MTTTETRDSRQMLDLAAKMVACGDRRQASMQMWEAAARRVGEIAEARGWPNLGAADTFAIVHHISVHTEDRQVRILFGLVSNTRQNFYEDWFSLDEVEDRLEDAQTLFELLDQAHRTLPAGLPMPNEPFYRQRHS